MLKKIPFNKFLIILIINKKSGGEEFDQRSPIKDISENLQMLPKKMRRVQFSKGNCFKNHSRQKF